MNTFTRKSKHLLSI